MNKKVKNFLFFREHIINSVIISNKLIALPMKVLQFEIMDFPTVKENPL